MTITLTAERNRIAQSDALQKESFCEQTKARQTAQLLGFVVLHTDR